ncbi:hypothetical protein [Streptomyces sp. NRRL S-1022]|uniref:hypothetical protein n=1 Tax=Streptomyces sp. NRRL S-1022 TaxID=1463880 RepID=UPI00068EB6F7
MPVEYGPWGRVHDLFRRWQWNGTRHRILTRLQSLADGKGAIAWDLSVDSTVCPAPTSMRPGPAIKMRHVAGILGEPARTGHLASDVRHRLDRSVATRATPRPEAS